MVELDVTMTTSPDIIPCAAASWLANTIGTNKLVMRSEGSLYVHKTKADHATLELTE